MESKLTLFIALVSFAILLQAGILLALYMAVRRMQSGMEGMQRRALPILEQSRELLTDLAPKARQVGANALDISVIARAQAVQIAATTTALNAKANAYIERTDDLINRTVSKVERTSETVERKVMVPVRTMNGVMAAVAAAVDSYRGVDRRTTPRDYDGHQSFDD
jgi:methyl-accepting chemotaxis protein